MVASFPCLMLYGIELPVQTSCKTTLNHFWPLISHCQSILCFWSFPTAWITPDRSGHPKLLYYHFLDHSLDCNDSLLTIFGPIPNLTFDCSKLLSLTTCGGSAWRSRTFHIFHPYVGGVSWHLCAIYTYLKWLRLQHTCSGFHPEKIWGKYLDEAPCDFLEGVAHCTLLVSELLVGCGWSQLVAY